MNAMYLNDKMKRVGKRLMKSYQARDYDKWKETWKESKIRRLYLLKTPTMVLLRGCITRAYRTWKSNVLHTIRLRTITHRFLLKMTRRSTFKAFSQWQFQIQQKMKYQNLIDRCSARRNQKYKKGCYFKWKRKVRNSIRKRNKTKKVLLRMTRHIVARGWRTWINIHTSEKRKEKKFLANGKKSKSIFLSSFFCSCFCFLF